jgi:UDP-N-acetyl-D-mannosaminuronic acid transferase (WecB/TagA/CpsF family)
MASGSSDPSRQSARNYTHNYTRILGINFFHGTAGEAVSLMRKNGGLLVVPAAPALKDMPTNSGYREALLNADLALADSGFMVIAWNLLTFSWMSRLSGLQYLRCLLRQEDIRQTGNVFWIMASQVSADCNLEWLEKQGIHVPADHVYIAPMYSRDLTDPELLAQLERLQPKHIILTLGGGTQERLGLYLKRGLTYRPAIHCIGAAIAFLSGDQVRIPAWADTLFLGWLFRSLSDPGRYVPRYWEARMLFGLMARYRDRAPELVERARR